VGGKAEPKRGGNLGRCHVEGLGYRSKKIVGLDVKGDTDLRVGRNKQVTSRVGEKNSMVPKSAFTDGKSGG